MRKLLLTALSSSLLIGSLNAGSLALKPNDKAPAEIPPVVTYDPTRHWELDFDTAALWSVGGNASPLDYTLLPQILSLKSAAMLSGPVGRGDLVLRNRISFLGEPIVEGPESYFIGLALAGSLEWWNEARTFSVFLSAGGGVGWMDSKGYEIEGGQGQDFNLNWFVHSGVRYCIRPRLSIAAGIYFQHISNGGQDDVNPGVNALGPTLGIGWHF